MTNLRKLAQGRECQIRIPGVCNGNPETVVLCHLGGAGMGRKHPDLLGAYGCSACHDAVDGRSRTNDDWRLYFYDGIFRTQRMLIDEGVINV